MSDEREALIERGARAYYEWACCGGEGSRWDDEGPHQEGARRFARERSAVFLDAFLGDRAALLAALGMEQVGWGARMKQYGDDDGTTGWFLDQTRTKLLAEYVPVWAARVSEEES